MQNIDNIPHRFRFVPIDENVTHGIAANNPTFIEHMDGSLTFCLAITPVDQDLYTPAILALNPVAYYLMSETAGSVLNDSSLSGFEGEIQETSAISYKADPLRKGSQGSMGFNIASNWTTAQCYVSDAVAGDTFKKLAASESSCTIAFWLKPESPRTYNWLAAYVLDKDSGTANYRVMAYNSYNIVGQSPHNQNQVISNETLGQMLGKNQFIVWRKDAATNTYSLTVNGVTNTVSGNSVDPVGDGRFYFPMSAGYSSFGLRGYMSDMSVFDYALTDSQIANLYQKGRIV